MGIPSACSAVHPMHLVTTQCVKYDHITYLQALQERINVMDSTAFSLCMENKMPIMVFGIKEENAILRAVMGEKIGTLCTDG